SYMPRYSMLPDHIYDRLRFDCALLRTVFGRRREYPPFGPVCPGIRARTQSGRCFLRMGSSRPAVPGTFLRISSDVTKSPSALAMNSKILKARALSTVSDLPSKLMVLVNGLSWSGPIIWTSGSGGAGGGGGFSALILVETLFSSVTAMLNSVLALAKTS